LKYILIVLLALCHGLVYGAEVDINKIIQIESSGNPLAVSFLGAKYGRGLAQVSESALADYNRVYSHTIAPESLFNPEVNVRVAKGYIEIIKGYLKHYGLPVNTKNILWAYNAGIGNVVKGIIPDETKEYLRKYEEPK